MASSAIDLFAGCGGLTLGLKSAGCDVLAAVEIDRTAASTYQLNNPKTNIRVEDIRHIDADSWRRDLGLERGQLDLLAGCPPCQGFSTLRTRNGGRQVIDERNELVLHVLGFVKAFLPRAVMVENVPGLAETSLFNNFVSELAVLGYSVRSEIRDTQFFGVPQRRKRLVMLGGLGFEPAFPSKLKTINTVRDAISQLPRAGDSGDLLHDFPETRSERTREIISSIPKNGGSRLDLRAEQQLRCHLSSNGFKDVYGRMAWDAVAPTITTGCYNPSKGRFLHPEEDRCVTMREVALLQSFPRSFEVPAGVRKTQVAKMLGNAFPPEFARRHAIALLRCAVVASKRRYLDIDVPDSLRAANLRLRHPRWAF